MGYPNRLEELLLLYSDKTTTVRGEADNIRVSFRAHYKHMIVEKHADICSGQLPDLTKVDDDGKFGAEAEERDEDGSLWVAACIPPSTSEESEEESPISVVHMGSPPPPIPTPKESTFFSIHSDKRITTSAAGSPLSIMLS